MIMIMPGGELAPTVQEVRKFRTRTFKITCNNTDKNLTFTSSLDREKVEVIKANLMKH